MEASVDLHPDFPVVTDTYQLTKEWSIDLPSPHNRRIEDDSLVLWQPGRTAWIIVWGNDHNESIEEKASWLKKDISANSYDLKEEISAKIYLIGYRLKEAESEKITYSYNGFAISNTGHVQISIYFDSEQDYREAENMLFSLTSSAP